MAYGRIDSSKSRILAVCITVKTDSKKFGRRYPWSKWFSCESIVLVKGVDYDCTTAGMAQMVRNVARRMKVRVSLRSFDDRMVFVVIKRNRDGCQ